MQLGLEGKVALVAASSKGLGRAVAEELAAEGARLVLCARGEAALAEARDAIEGATGAAVIAVPADIGEPEGVERVVAAALDAHSRVDILVTNAGGPPAGPFESHAPEAWRDAVRINLESVVNLTRAVLPGMKERRWGRIINITSIAVKQPVDGLILSNSVRAAVTGFARTLANEVAPFGITVNNVLPGYTRTRRVEELAERTAAARGITPDEALQAWVREIPMRRLGEPRELAALVAFLASERAGFITGVSVPVDGGWARGLL
ncbi:MAG TPA: SDR family oxidoreductase [Longimicrobiales bacterium]